MSGEATRILDALANGEAGAADELLPLVYGELRKLAAHQMAHERPGHTLEPTALVHEAWLRLAGRDDQRWDGRTHFFAAAAESMRRILIDRARRRNALKRAGRWQRVDVDALDLAAPPDDETLLFVHEALDELASEDPPSAELVRLRFFAGMTNREAAEALGVSERTAKRFWTFARAWLCERLSTQADRQGGGASDQARPAPD